MVSVRTLREEKVMSFKPDLKPYNTVGRFKFWCQKVLPTVYDNSLSYYEVLNKIVKYLNDLIENVDTAEENIVALADAFEELENEFNNLSEDVKGYAKRVSFTPMSFRGIHDLGNVWYMFNTGANTSNPVPNQPEADTSMAICEATFTNNEGDHPSEVFFELGRDEWFPLQSTDDYVAFAYIYYSGSQRETADLFFTIGGLSNDRIGMEEFTLTPGINIVPIHGELISGVADGRYDATTFGIKFYSTGHKKVLVSIIKKADTFTSMYDSYIRSIEHKADDNATRYNSLNGRVTNLETANRYSSDEIDVGSWINGKTVYQKTIRLGSPTVDVESSFPHSISSMLQCIDIKGYAIVGSYYHPIAQVGSIYVDTTNIHFAPLMSLNDSYVTIQYTKDTD